MDEVMIPLTKELNSKFFAFVFQQCVLPSNSSLPHHEEYLTLPSSYYHSFKKMNLPKKLSCIYKNIQYAQDSYSVGISVPFRSINFE